MSTIADVASSDYADGARHHKLLQARAERQLASRSEARA